MTPPANELAGTTQDAMGTLKNHEAAPYMSDLAGLKPHTMWSTRDSGSQQPHWQGDVIQEEKKMSLVKKRLSTLWLRQSRTPFLPRAKADQNTARMFVHLREPLRMPGTVLAPGRYVFRPLDGGTNCDFVQILSEDQTELLATVATVTDR